MTHDDAQTIIRLLEDIKTYFTIYAFIVIIFKH